MKIKKNDMKALINFFKDAMSEGDVKDLLYSFCLGIAIFVMVGVADFIFSNMICLILFIVSFIILLWSAWKLKDKNLELWEDSKK